MQEEKKSSNSSFITLTYDEAHLPREPKMLKGISIPNPEGRPTLFKPHLAQFHKSLKEFERRQGGTNLSYYSAGEYGSKFGRPHYHTILMNHRPEVIDQLPSLWNKGIVHVGTVTPASIAYVSKYIIDQAGMNHKPVRPFNMMSKGIGDRYLSTAMINYHRPDDDTDNMIYFVKHEGKKYKMPRYYRDRIFTDEERRILGEMQYLIGMKAKSEAIEALALQELDTDELKMLNDVERGWKGWERGLKRYLEQIEAKHEKIKLKSLQSNSL